MFLFFIFFVVIEEKIKKMKFRGGSGMRWRCFYDYFSRERCPHQKRTT